MLMIMVSSSVRSMSMSSGSTTWPSGMPEHGAHLTAELAGIGGGASAQLLVALGRLGHQQQALVAQGGLVLRDPVGRRCCYGARGLPGRGLPGVGAVFFPGGGSVVCVDLRLRVAHLGPGAPLNCTGTRPTP